MSNERFLNIARDIDLKHKTYQVERYFEWLRERKKQPKKEVRMTPEEMKAVRKGMFISQTELAKRLRITRQTVVNYESGVTKIPYVVELALKSLNNQKKEAND